MFTSFLSLCFVVFDVLYANPCIKSKFRHVHPWNQIISPRLRLLWSRNVTTRDCLLTTMLTGMQLTGAGIYCPVFGLLLES